ncbi:hypothetical protein EJ04DRAFT_520576 [Polyplosphaeria fusca]|uniref:Uncharacterized protein n=1 Tax=Polyplosphaeria fusca TaxID=682080 RepID=A0A9P4R4P8_9PLEO|nr:hypothetical protein EJ04DRAFT_520576 [Polyplosphaeria fusca]
MNAMKYHQASTNQPYRKASLLSVLCLLFDIICRMTSLYGEEYEALPVLLAVGKALRDSLESACCAARGRNEWRQPLKLGDIGRLRLVMLKSGTRISRDVNKHSMDSHADPFLKRPRLHSSRLAGRASLSI